MIFRDAERKHLLQQQRRRIAAQNAIVADERRLDVIDPARRRLPWLEPRRSRLTPVAGGFGDLLPQLAALDPLGDPLGLGPAVPTRLDAKLERRTVGAIGPFHDCPSNLIRS
jgi:hypothetical protein